MCKETTSSSDKGNEIESEEVEVGLNGVLDGSGKEETSPKRRPWWKGGGVIPMSGEDLGVFDKSLEDQANIFELWWMSYLNPLLDLGSRKVLETNDVGIPSDQDRAARAYSCAKKAWDDQVEYCRIKNEPLIKLQKEREAQLQEQQAKEPKLGDSDIGNKKKKEPKPIVLKEPSITMSLVYSFGAGKIVLALIYQILSSLLAFVPVLILNDLVMYFEWHSFGASAAAAGDETIPPFKPFVNPWLEVVGLGIVPLLVSIFQTRHNAIMAHLGIFVRTAVSTLLYKKALSVSAAGRAMTSTGQVVNMMSNDTMQLQRFLQFAGFTVTAPIQIIIALALIYKQVGNATWVGVAYMVFLLPVNTWVFSVVAKMRRKVLKHSDARVKMMNEILTGIRIIKFYAWERPFGGEVERVRAKEMDALTKMSYVVAVGFSIILLSTPIVQPIFVFLTYVNIQPQPLTAATAFTTIALFNLMRFPFAFMPMGLLQFIQSKISLKRLERYLLLPELHPYVLDEGTSEEVGGVYIRDGSFGWVNPDGMAIKPIQEEERSKKKERAERKEKRAQRRASRKSSATVKTDSSQSNLEELSSASVSTEESAADKVPIITLRNITTTIKPGSLVAVVGSVGSGKSSLLSAILGEMESIGDSKVYVPRDEIDKGKNGYVSYCTQSPWVINDTLKGNILFGREFDQERYDEILSACALLDDIAVLPAGDATEIGKFDRWFVGYSRVHWHYPFWI